MSQQKSADWVRLAQSPSQTERIEAFFGGHGYEPHRHDTYAIGQTIAGVQSFHYRGGLQHSLPGGTMVLHPDEIHDGEAGTEHIRLLSKTATLLMNEGFKGLVRNSQSAAEIADAIQKGIQE